MGKMGTDKRVFAKKLARSLAKLSGFKARVVPCIAGREASLCIKWHYGETKYALFVDDEGQLPFSEVNIVQVHWTIRGKTREVFVEKDADAAAASFLAKENLLQDYAEAI